jgi:MOSC domain-containing protein YiiM
MKLISVNVGQERAIPNAKASGKTGIYKQPVSTTVKITSHGIEEDVICDTKHHGGLDQAIYIYGLLDYQWWSNALGKELFPGTFGENLTISELESAMFQIGDRLEIGTVTLQVTAPRGPCVTLAARMGDPGFIKRFQKAERPGLYCRVLKSGEVRAGNLVRLEPFTGETVTILEMFRDENIPDLRETTLKRYLAAPIAVRARAKKEKQLRMLVEESGS